MRPDLNEKISVEDFDQYYWLKAELVAFCRTVGLVSNGGKLEIAQRIKTYLATGELPNKEKKKQPLSNFNWSTEKLTARTVITDNYKNTENVRLFFQHEIGPKFKFNVQFMNWMKGNSGKSLQDAVVQWQLIVNNAKNKKQRKEIAPQFEYNTYIRDFLAGNPGLSRAEAILCWNVKKTLKGSNVYEDSDLKFIRKQ